MPALTVNLYPVTTRCNRIGECRFFIQLLAHLIEIGNL